MKKLLIIHKKQFGYHTDTFEISRTLNSQLEITYVCFDSNMPKITMPKVDIIYVDSKGSFMRRALRFIEISNNFIKKDFNYVFLGYFSFCSILKILSSKNIILDFRTGSVNKSNLKRYLDDSLKSLEAKLFNRITVISEGIRKKLYISKQKTYILPLGANELSNKLKSFKTPKLFYIGTFNNREVHKTILGVALFLEKFPKLKEHLTYDIVGFGYEREEINLNDIINELKLSNNIMLHGRKSHEDVKYLFDECNIGISFIPITSYYDHQPPTKTFEYILAGMICMATSTKENEKYINEKNGVLHLDNPQSFSLALEKTISDFNIYTSKSIRETLKQNTWENIASNFKTYVINGK